MELRAYQKQAVEAVYDYLRHRDGNPCVVIPTAGGKTAAMATICRDAVNLWDGRVLILAHVKELLEQTAGTLSDIAPDLDIGIYSAGLKRRDTDHRIIVAGIQSVYKRACDLGRFDLILVDEAHMIPPDGEGMYRTFLSDARTINPHIRLIGLTATPYRMSSGMICGPDNLLHEICYEVGVRELIVQGFLCPLKSKAGKQKADTSGLHIRGGEFIAPEVEDLMDQDALVSSACSEIIEQTADRNSVLIFASGVHHARHIKKVLQQRIQQEVGLVTGDTPALERAELLACFKKQPVRADLFKNNKSPLKYMVNVNVLTTGFDAPNIDCVVLLRPTNSPGLYYQMCLDMDTEVLTENGWAKCDEVKKGDFVASFDTNDSQIKWCKALDKVHRRLAPGESFYGIRSPHLDIRVTNKHTMIYKGRSHSCKNWMRRDAEELAKIKNCFYVPIAGENDGPGLPLTDDELRFIGWVFADGYMNPNNWAITITQSVNSPYNKDIVSMLEGCCMGYRLFRQKLQGEFARYPDSLMYTIPYGQPRSNNAHLRGWKDLLLYFTTPILNSFKDVSKRQLQIMLEGMNLADGCKRKNITWNPKVITLCMGHKKYFADQLQILLIMRGFRCNLYTQNQITTTWHKNGKPKTQHMLHIKPQTKATIGGAINRPSSLVKNRCQFQPLPFSPDEKVWCLTTPYGSLVTRRNGKVAIVGNCGRGFRLSPSKEDCLVLDFGGNILRHGPVDDLQIKDRSGGNGQAPAKECPECHSVIHAAYATCPDCGYEFPPPEREKHDSKASTAGILSGHVEDNEYEVHDTVYHYHIKRNAGPDDPPTLRVDYELGFNHWQSEWICLEHTGYARAKAEGWWRARSNEPVPDTVEEALALAEAGALAQTKQITVRSITGQKFDRIIKYVLGPKPSLQDVDEERDNGHLPNYSWAEDDIPF